MLSRYPTAFLQTFIRTVLLPLGMITMSTGILSCQTFAEDPLHVRIDRLIRKQTAIPFADRSSDANFLRRVSLDFVGQIPTAKEVRAFMQSTDPSKRQAVIDALLADTRYADRMTDVFNVMLIERRAKHDDWIEYLHDAFAANKPWNQMCREMLAPNADDEVTRASAFFHTSRLAQYGQNPPDVPGLVRDVGRMFLGVDVQCAECHDHLTVDDYKQVDYQGLYAFVANTSLRRDVKFPAVAEKPLVQKISFKSVFVGDEEMTGPRLPGGTEIEIPESEAGKEYLVPPDKKLGAPGVLKFSPLKVLAEALPTGQNKAFARNITNRLWWLMMGRGLVEPLDLHHSDNSPSHPELLDLLATEFTKQHFDIKWLLRELALTETYQRSGLLPEGANEQTPLTTYCSALERPMSALQIMMALQKALGESVSEEKAVQETQIRFEKAFANPPKEPEVTVTPTVKGALFLSNDQTVLHWFQRHEGNLVDRLAKLELNRAIIDEAYLSVLSRLPTDEECNEMDEFISDFPGPRERAIGHLAWALASSTEFFVNH